MLLSKTLISSFSSPSLTRKSSTLAASAAALSSAEAAASSSLEPSKAEGSATWSSPTISSVAEPNSPSKRISSRETGLGLVNPSGNTKLQA